MAGDEMFSDSEEEYEFKDGDDDDGDDAAVDSMESDFAQSSDEEEQEFEDEDSDDNVAIGKLRKPKTPPPPSVSGSGSEDDFIDDSDNDFDGDSDDYTDSDDDVPLSKLKSSPKKGAKAKKATSKKKKTVKSKSKTSKSKKTTEKKKKTPKSPKSTPKKDVAKNNSGPITASFELYQKCEKGKLIQSALCRWWYAMTWPATGSFPEAPPPNHDSLEGFPGVFVCTKGDNVGKILDYRDKDTCPNFINFAKKSSEELKEFLLKAIAKQKEQLIKHEGEGTHTEKDLAGLEKWARKLNAHKADKEAAKVLKAARLTLQ